MKLTILAAAALISLGLAPAKAGEGIGEPFPNNAGAVTTQTALTGSQTADTGSAAYPNFAGRPASDLPRLAGNVLPASGSESAIQTANSLPAHFEERTVAYAQATRIQNWMLAHSLRRTPAFAAVSPMHAPGG